MFRSPKLQAGLLAVALLAAGAADARTSDRNQPMDIEADRSDCGLGDNASCTLVGNVSITQGSMQVGASREAFSRALRLLADLGLIQSTFPVVRILDTTKLQRYARG